MSVIVIRPYRPADAASLVRLFQASVRVIAARDYDPSQIRAWAPDNINEQQFGERCQSKLTWVAQVAERSAGFSDLEPDGHVDMLYVHPDFQRRGVARALLQHVEEAARAGHLPRLYAEASITARPFFEAMEFRVIAPQTVTIRGASIRNYRMEKPLNLRLPS